MGESRHNQDQLLKAIQADEENRNKGHLKIFFGYAAGNREIIMLTTESSTNKELSVA